MSKLMQTWKRELDATLRKCDVKAFKKFYRKWQVLGFYELMLPDDKVVEVSIYKMLYNLDTATEKDKEKAKKWLDKNGYTTEM